MLLCPLLGPDSRSVAKIHDHQVKWTKEHPRKLKWRIRKLVRCDRKTFRRVWQKPLNVKKLDITTARLRLMLVVEVQSLSSTIILPEDLPKAFNLITCLYRCDSMGLEVHLLENRSPKDIIEMTQDNLCLNYQWR